MLACMVGADARLTVATFLQVLHDEGYDDMDALKELESAEVDEVVEELCIPKGILHLY